MDDKSNDNTILQQTKTEIKNNIVLILFKIIIPIVIIGILLTSFLMLIFKIDTADKKGNKKKWISVAGPISTYSSSSSIGGGTIIEVAAKMHKYMEKNNYFWTVDSTYLKDTFEESKKTKGVCCASYVSYVLTEAGYIKASEMSHGADSLAEILKNKGFKEVKKSELKAGDILWFPGNHVEIYAGNNQSYNAGDTDIIRGSAPSNSSIDYYDGNVIGLRPPR